VSSTDFAEWLASRTIVAGLGRGRRGAASSGPGLLCTGVGRRRLSALAIGVECLATVRFSTLNAGDAVDVRLVVSRFRAGFGEQGVSALATGEECLVGECFAPLDASDAVDVAFAVLCFGAGAVLNLRVAFLTGAFSPLASAIIERKSILLCECAEMV
jgi:hypothetical protein